MVKERILAKLDELDLYMSELREIMPKSYEEYINSIEKKRSCERLLHISIECVIDICALLAKEINAGIPSGEEDMFAKLEKKGAITTEMKDILKRMKGFRNVLVHRYEDVDDELVYENLNRLDEFRKFENEIRAFLAQKYE